MTISSLLPLGFSDRLMGDAERIASVTEQFMSVFGHHGYRRVDPPLLEFEDTLLAGPGQAVALQTFRLMDPLSHRMMGVRADLTPQISRLAASRLKDEPRPLRLCYAGDVVRVKGDDIDSQRQMRQVGCELVGSSSARADAEIIRIAVSALKEAGIKNVTVDLTCPPLVPLLCQYYNIDPQQSAKLRDFLERKDYKAVSAMAPPVFADLLKICGIASDMLPRLKRLELPDMAQPSLQRLYNVVDLLSDLTLTLDATERNGFEYYTGLGFVLFSPQSPRELGRGGRYRSGRGTIWNQDEKATGFSFNMASVLNALPPIETPGRIYCPVNTPAQAIMDLQNKGWVTIAALEQDENPYQAALQQQCQAIWQDGLIEELDKNT